jgi:hypothetical protein
MTGGGLKERVRPQSEKGEEDGRESVCYGDNERLQDERRKADGERCITKGLSIFIKNPLDKF